MEEALERIYPAILIKRQYTASCYRRIPTDENPCILCDLKYYCQNEEIKRSLWKTSPCGNPDFGEYLKYEGEVNCVLHSKE